MSLGIGGAQPDQVLPPTTHQREGAYQQSPSRCSYLWGTPVIARPYVYSVRLGEWRNDLNCVCCKRRPAMWMSGLAYWCGSPEGGGSCAHILDDYKLAARRRVRENKSAPKRGRRAGRAVRRRYQ